MGTFWGYFQGKASVVGRSLMYSKWEIFLLYFHHLSGQHGLCLQRASAQLEVLNQGASGCPSAWALLSGEMAEMTPVLGPGAWILAHVSSF